MTDGHVLSPALTVQDRGDRRSPNKWGSLHEAGPKWPIFREPGVVTWLGNIRNKIGKVFEQLRPFWDHVYGKYIYIYIYIYKR